MSSPSSTSSATATTSDGPGFTGNAGNYFYGFLVTFVGLLLIFVSCGINIRRRIRDRRNLWLGFTVTVDETTLPPEEEQEEPDFYEPKFVNNASPTWAEVMPLSLSVKREVTQQTIMKSPPAISPTRNPHALHGLSLPSWKPQEKSVITSHSESLHVVLMVAMPGKNDDSKEYQFGVVQVPWDSKEKSEAGAVT